MAAVLSLADFVNGDVYFREGPTYTEGIGGYQYGGKFAFLESGDVIYSPRKINASGLDIGIRTIKWMANDTTVEFPGILAPEVDADVNLSDINSNATSVGFAETTPGTITNSDYRAMRWTIDGVATELSGLQDSIPGSVRSFAYGINDAGVTVGTAHSLNASSASIDGFPYRWDANSSIPEALATLGLSTSGRGGGNAWSINNSGLIGGDCRWISSTGEMGGSTPALWDSDGNLTLLQAIGSTDDGYQGGRVRFVSESGSAFGEAVKHDADSGIYSRPARWETASITPIEYEVMGTNSSGEIQFMQLTDFNDSHYSIARLTKYESNFPPRVRAVRWDPMGHLTELTFPGNPAVLHQSSALSINNSEIVAGGYHDGTEFVACVWLADGTRVDMETMAALPSGWQGLRLASSIDDTGWVGGDGMFDPDGNGGAVAYPRAFMLLVPQFGTYGLGDANFDTHVDFADLLIVAPNYGESNNPVSTNVGDFDLDGDVDFNDLLTIAQNYGQLGLTLGESSQFNTSFTMEWNRALASVPEPGSLMLVSVGMLAIRRRR